ncbi:hypothetical protein FR483_n713L [Paramecium bursaria Chlorella virus FR483]|uniref:Uncharacterized protein n713L n=1 Tax=Paramecium bursaria Chlorella virus FR483 TaxID=399781 RepID=A7J867_PBCVF|nr:hypothetical protein FR483_n713L [Paramecium bursaria Chlorella virus FR483]ABT15998.1 hypothetical protein FR483_n713L [Paramecium bursaria Chlorella virus FR483]
MNWTHLLSNTTLMPPRLWRGLCWNLVLAAGTVTQALGMVVTVSPRIPSNCTQTLRASLSLSSGQSWSPTLFASRLLLTTLLQRTLKSSAFIVWQ